MDKTIRTNVATSEIFGATMGKCKNLCRCGLLTLLQVAFVSLAFSHGAVAEVAASIEAEQVQSKLDAIDAEINEYRKLLERTRNQRSEIEAELQSNETEIGDLIRRIEKIEQELKQSQDKISKLHGEKNQLETAKARQQQFIKEQIRAAYAIGNQPHLKVLLNQEDPAEISRMLTYYDYFNRARVEQVERYAEILASLSRVETRITAETKQLETSRNQVKSQYAKLSVSRDKRKLTLVMLKNTLQDREAKLAKLAADRKGLESLLDKINQSSDQFPVIDEFNSFADLKGKMLYPLKGKVTNRFGSSRNNGKLHWQGIFISASEGEAVHAVHNGRVVFSDWLRGFGLLMIINHGDGYMSLYGHNQTLYRQTGDWVASNETIALTGNSGGQDRSGLYFEIRHSGKPRNPQSWCVARA